MSYSVRAKFAALVVSLPLIAAVGCNFDPGTADGPEGTDADVELDTIDEGDGSGGDTAEEDTSQPDTDIDPDTEIPDVADGGDTFDTRVTDGGDTAGDTADGGPDDTSGDTDTDDTGTTDIDVNDTGIVDTGTVDSGTNDTGFVDSGTVDSGTTDTGTGDTASDTGLADADAAVCGNGIVEAGEECDDGNQTTGDGCTANCKLPTAFRIDDAQLVDPHVSAKIGLTCSCTDVTNTVNTQFQNEIDSYNVNLLEVFRPLDLTQSTNRMDFYPDADCNDNDFDNVAECSPGTSPVYQATANNEVGSGNTCFSANSTRTNASYTSPNSPSDPCFSTTRKDVSVQLLGCSIQLQDTTIAAEYSSSSSPTDLSNGVLTGFVSENEAKNCSISNALLCNSPRTLYEILDESNDNCGTAADKDTNGGTPGWWFYINITSASEAEWTQ